MYFVTRLPQTSRGHDAMCVIVDRLTKSAHFLAVRMTFTLDELCKLYVREIVRLHGGHNYSIGLESQVYDSLFEKFSTSHGDTVDDEHNFSSPDERSVKKDHPDFRGHAN